MKTKAHILITVYLRIPQQVFSWEFWVKFTSTLAKQHYEFFLKNNVWRNIFKINERLNHVIVTYTSALQSEIEFFNRLILDLQKHVREKGACMFNEFFKSTLNKHGYPYKSISKKWNQKSRWKTFFSSIASTQPFCTSKWNNQTNSWPSLCYRHLALSNKKWNRAGWVSHQPPSLHTPSRQILAAAETKH